MKKIIMLFSILATFAMSIESSVLAQTSIDHNKEIVTVETEMLEDGCVIETIIVEEIKFSRDSSKTGTKTVNYKNGSTTLWSVSVKGTYIYNGSATTCTNSRVSAISYSSYWKISGKSNSRSGNTAIAKATGKRYTVGVVVQSITREVTLSCDKNGKLY